MWCVLLAVVCLTQGIVGESPPREEEPIYPVIGGGISAPDTRPTAVIKPKPTLLIEPKPLLCPPRCTCETLPNGGQTMSCVGKPLSIKAEPCPPRCKCEYAGPKITSMGCVGKPLVGGVLAPDTRPVAVIKPKPTLVLKPRPLVMVDPPPPDMVGLPEPAPTPVISVGLPGGDPKPCPKRCTCETLPNGAQTMSCVGEPLSIKAEPCPERCECEYEGPKIVAMGCSGPGVMQTAPPCWVINCAVCEPDTAGRWCDTCEKGFKLKKGGSKCVKAKKAKKPRKPRKPRRKVGK